MFIKIISANIRFEGLNDGIHKWENRKPILSNIFNDFKSDLIGTQEGREEQVRELSRELPNLFLVDRHRVWIDERMYPNIFVNPTTVDVLDSGDIWLSESPDVPGSSSFASAFPRLCVWIKGEFKECGKKFIFVNTHLDHLSEETRVMQADVLIKEIRVINDESLPIIISGDFNSAPDQKVMPKLLAELPDLYDPWIKLENKEDSSYHKFQGLYPEGKRIDWLLVDRKFEVESIFLNKHSEDNIYPSDHFPLMSIFELD